MNYREPVIGEKIYIPTSLYISHGEDDVAGGLATIYEVEKKFNTVFVTVEEVIGHSYNWQILLEKQEEYAKTYAGCIAHNDPDYTDYSES